MDKYKVPVKLSTVLGSRDNALGIKEHLDSVVAEFESRLDADRETASKLDNYSIPAWSERMADHMGYQRALREMIGLLKIKEKQN